MTQAEALRVVYDVLVARAAAAKRWAEDAVDDTVLAVSFYAASSAYTIAASDVLQCMSDSDTHPFGD